MAEEAQEEVQIRERPAVPVLPPLALSRQPSSKPSRRRCVLPSSGRGKLPRLCRCNRDCANHPSVASWRLCSASTGRSNASQIAARAQLNQTTGSINDDNASVASIGSRVSQGSGVSRASRASRNSRNSVRSKNSERDMDLESVMSQQSGESWKSQSLRSEVSV